MDDAGIDVAMLSISTPGVHVGDDKRARTLARRCNEFAAQLVQFRPDRFGSFADVPLPDVDGALEELGYALDVLRLDGLIDFTADTTRAVAEMLYSNCFARTSKSVLST